MHDIKATRPEPEYITIEHRDDGIAVLTLNRPEILNAINWKMHEEIEIALYDLTWTRPSRLWF